MTATLNSNPLSPARNLSLIEPPRSPSTIREFPSCKFIRKEPKSVRFSQRVRFAKMAFVKETISRNDMTSVEKQGYWIQGSEYSRIRNENRETVASMRHRLETKKQRINEQSESMCYRGLESGIPSVSDRKRKFRENAAQEVFIEQEDQYFAGFYDDDAISSVYYHVASQCQFAALLLAMQDQKDAEAYQQEPCKSTHSTR